MRIRTLAELTTPDGGALHFGPMGLGGGMRPESAAEYQQQTIFPAQLVPEVPDGTRQSFEQLRNVFAYGVLCYDLYTFVDDQALLVLELALRERFVALYEGRIPLISRDGSDQPLVVRTFD